MVRPFDGFYAMKYESKGRMWIAFLNFVLLSISISFRTQFSAIIVNDRHPHAISSVNDFIIASAALLLFCTANWAVTSLTDGEGKFKDIFMSVCYAMTPMVLTFIPAALLSNLLTYEEGGFYTMIIVAAIFYFAVLVFAGLVSVHNYSATKAILTVLLTAVSLIVIIFLITLLLSLKTQRWILIQRV